MPYEIGRDSRCPRSKPYGVRKKDGKKLLGCHASRASAQRQMAAIGMHEAGKEKQMPYPNEHACRIKDPGSFQAGSFRRISRGGKAGKGPRDGKKVSIIIGRPKGKTTTATQSFRYPKDDWTEAQARQHCQEQGGSFEAASGGEKGVDPMTEFFLSDDLALEDEQLEQKATEPGEAEVLQEEVLDDYSTAAISGDATSFAGLHKLKQATEYAGKVDELASQFSVLAGNILASPDVEDKAAALEALATEFAGLVRNPPEKEDKEVARPAGWFDNLVERVKTALGLGQPEREEETPGFMIWKEADGSYRWLARYSNNFRDQDNPPEIISSDSHKHFDQMLTKGEAPMPELWLWHRPEWRWGAATWHAYDDAGFALAAGTVNKGCEPLADKLMELDPALVRVSHGMPTQSIVRDEADESVIVQHVTREISPLPAWAAANARTGFIILKETDMAIPEEKRRALQDEWDLSNELLTQLEAANAADAKEADEAGIESKEVEKAETLTEPEPEPAPEPELAPAEPGVTRAEMAQALQAIGQAITALSEQIKEIQGQVIEVKETKDIVEAETLSEIFERAIGHKDARVDGRTSAAKDRPAEVKDPEAVVNTGNPLADQIVNQIVSGEWKASFQRPQ